MWPDRRLLDLFGIEFPILLAPMAGAMDAELAVAAARGGALASLPCAMLTPEKTREQVGVFRQQIAAPINLNFFCHQQVTPDAAREQVWRQRLTRYFAELGLDPAMPAPAASRAPF
ncbi:2-nitropropane dioxygenase, partial [Rhodopseudomonas sp. WA056]|uniref:nitronate monooxygenase n=1 Tax=Rhodopseudomonas sp. WA056 TaxID=2269367 RepID=UPI00196876A2